MSFTKVKYNKILMDLDKNALEASSKIIESKEKQEFKFIDVIFFFLSCCIILSAFLKWAYMSEIRITDYLPHFKIITCINGVASLSFLSPGIKAKRSGFIALIINLIMFSIYYSDMYGTDHYGIVKTEYITIHFGFWLGFIATIIAFIIALNKIFRKKENK